MNTYSKDYSLLKSFIKNYLPSGFNGIDPDDPQLLELEIMMEQNDQFCLVCDIIRIDTLYTSQRSRKMIGIDPGDVSLYHFFEGTHPDDIQRHSLTRSKLFKMAQEFFIAGKGEAILSSNFKIRNAAGEYTNLLFQCYLFYTEIPFKTVLLLQVHTNIEWYKKMKHHYHFYAGKNLSYFKYPDEKLLMTGNILSDREFEIVKLIEMGLSSNKIAEKLYLSSNTINTHRRNILDKTHKPRISDLIYELQEYGLM